MRCVKPSQSWNPLGFKQSRRISSIEIISSQVANITWLATTQPLYERVTLLFYCIPLNTFVMSIHRLRLLLVASMSKRMDSISLEPIPIALASKWSPFQISEMKGIYKLVSSAMEAGCSTLGLIGTWALLGALSYGNRRICLKQDWCAQVVQSCAFQH